MPFGICALRAVDALGTRTAMALGRRCHRSAEGDDALLRCLLLRTRCVGFWFGSGFGSRREGDCPFAGCRAFLFPPLWALPVWCFGLRYGSPVGAFAAQAFVLVCLCVCWHPRFVSSLHASPLCGAAATFLCRRKEK